MFARALAMLTGGLLMGPTPTAWSSIDTGTIEGTIKDERGAPVAGARVIEEAGGVSALSNSYGRYRLEGVTVGRAVVAVRAVGFTPARRIVLVGQGQVVRADFVLRAGAQPEAEEKVADSAERDRLQVRSVAPSPSMAAGMVGRQRFNTEDYKHIVENDWRSPREAPLSTFSIDVDAASYSNVRRFIADGTLPPADAVRIEELINYFRYDYPEPRGRDPFTVTTELGDAPWAPGHKLALIGLQSRRIEMRDLPPNNLVFLLDVSGSMGTPNKLPLVKKAFRLLVNELRDEDRVAIAVYAGAAGLVLPSTSGRHKDRILDALDRLQAGGSTAGGAGIQLAYQTARDHFIEGGNNRVILATDGDFNVGVSSEGGLIRLIEERRRDGVFLTVLGFGTGNLKDSKMELLADKGNGHYAYIDDLLEAKKVLVQELGSTLLTVAKDVKLQVEFNPARVASYRLVGYENRKLNDEDFNDDRKDAGDMGAGHSVTALYEIVPVGVERDDRPRVDPLKYQERREVRGRSGDWLTVKIRYKEPEASRSRLLERIVRAEDEETSMDFRFASAVAGFGMLLRDSEHKGELSWRQVIALARGAKGNDPDGYRGEFIRLVEAARALSTHDRDDRGPVRRDDRRDEGDRGRPRPRQR